MVTDTLPKEAETDAAIRVDHQKELQAVRDEQAIKASEKQQAATMPLHRGSGGVHLVVGGAWTLIVLQVLVIVGSLIHGHVRAPTIEALLSEPNSHTILSSIGFLLGVTLPGIAALAGGLSLRKRTSCETRTALNTLAVLTIVAMVGLQFMPGLNHVQSPTFLSTTQMQQAQQRTLSTPSMRLPGRWRNVDTDGEIQYSTIDADLGFGTYRLRNPGGVAGPAFRFKVVSEDPSGATLILRDFNPTPQELAARMGMDWSQSDVVCSISGDGRQMTQEYTIRSGSYNDRAFSVYRKID